MSQSSENGQLKIFRASAGSGKTHSIAKQFLKLVLPDNPQRFKNILAVTFTNKAAEEMRIRIIKALSDVSEKGSKSDFIDIEDFKHLNDQELKQRADLTRTAILHSFSYFSVSTIDSFIQRIVRNFAYEMRIPVTFELELDQNIIIDSITEILLEKVENSVQLRNWLIRFMNEKIKDEKSWNITKDIKNLARLIFKEEFLEIWENQKGKQVFQKHILSQLEEILDNIIADYEQYMTELYSKAEEIFSQLPDNINFGRSVLGTIINNWRKAPLSLNQNLWDKKSIINFVDNPEPISLLSKKLRENPQLVEFVDNHASELYQLLKQGIQYASQYAKAYNTAKTIKQNFYIIGIFSDLLEALQEYQRRFNKYFIAQMTAFLRELISHSDAPFIYEKIGQYYHYVLFDEFQDTSRFQWDIFSPLVKESLAQGHSSILVGDVKQAIYRWRNGDWNLMLYRVPQEFKDRLEYVNKGKSTNWRSHRNIVKFNNQLFVNLAKSMQDIFNTEVKSDGKQTITDAYNDVVQQISPKHKDIAGRVEINFLPKKSDFTEAVIQTIIKLKEQGYRYSDIAILVRTNEQIKQIAQGLLAFRNQNPQYDFSVISNATLFLTNSPAIGVIIAFLKYLVFEDIYYLRLLVHHLSHLDGFEIDYGNFFVNSEVVMSYLPNDFLQFVEQINSKTLYDIIQQLISYFKLDQNPEQYPYLRSFEDIVIDFMYQEGSDLELFLQHWDSEGDNYTVDVPENSNAIKILTIHRAKGLAFPIVIMPSVNWQITGSNWNAKIIWAKAEEEPFNILPVYPVIYKKELNDTYFSEAFQQETLYQMMDSLNVLYVGFTRPIHQLIVFSSKTKKGSTKNIGDILYNTVSNLDFMQKQENENVETFVYEKDFIPVYDFSQASEEKVLHLENYKVGSWLDKTDIVLNARNLLMPQHLKEAAERGTLMHEIMENVKTFDDIDRAVQKLVNQGKIPADQASALALSIKNMITKAGVKDWFSDQWQVLTEYSIILAEQAQEVRPDRIIMNDRKIIIIDFKFAKPSNEHLRQVSNYAKIIKQMFPDKTVEAYLLYETGKLTEVEI